MNIVDITAVLLTSSVAVLGLAIASDKFENRLRSVRWCVFQCFKRDMFSFVFFMRI